MVYVHITLYCIHLLSLILYILYIYIYIPLSNSLSIHIHVDYSQYPMDNQKLLLTVYSMGFVNVFLKIRGLTDTLFMDSDLGSIWNYVQSSVAFSQTEDEDFSTCNITIEIARQSLGVVYRLAFPIMLLLLLVGLTFWGEHASRVDTTITILLSVSALYIVVFSSVPMIGTLTEFDKYIIVVRS